MKNINTHYCTTVKTANISSASPTVKMHYLRHTCAHIFLRAFSQMRLPLVNALCYNYVKCFMSNDFIYNHILERSVQAVETGKLGALVRRVLAGDAPAYESIFLETKDNIFFHAKMMLKSDESAWDTVQDTYIAAFRGLDKLRTPETVETWLCAIAGNLCFNRIKRQNQPQNDNNCALSPPVLSADDDTVRDYVQQAMDELAIMPRVAVLFRYCDDMSLAQIGSVMRCDETAVKKCLAQAEETLCIVRDSTDDQCGITPTRLKQALHDIRKENAISPAITLSIGLAIAQKCGYASSLRVISAADTQANQRKGGNRASSKSENENDSKRPMRPTARERAARGAKKGVMVLASGLVVVGFVVGGFAVRAIMDARSADAGTPDNLSAFSAGHNSDKSAADAGGNNAQPDQALSAEAAQAYISIISDYTGRYGVCSSTDVGDGLAYATLLDFDGDGQQEMYLYYIDNSFLVDSSSDAVNNTGETLYCLHEELWRFDGQLQCCFSQQHYAGGDMEDGTGTSRWVVQDDNSTSKFVTWYTYTDENGYIHQISVSYTLSGNVLAESERTEGMFVVANAANQRRDGYLIEQYYGTENAHYDDIAYFVEGAVTTPDGRTAYTYEQSQAILDASTADVVPLNTEETDTPAARLKEAYDVRKQGTQLIAVDGSDTGYTMSWAVNDVNGFLSTLADLCMGK